MCELHFTAQDLYLNGKRKPNTFPSVNLRRPALKQEDVDAWERNNKDEQIDAIVENNDEHLSGSGRLSIMLRFAK